MLQVVHDKDPVDIFIEMKIGEMATAGTNLHGENKMRSTHHLPPSLLPHPEWEKEGVHFHGVSLSLFLAGCPPSGRIMINKPLTSPAPPRLLV